MALMKWCRKIIYFINDFAELWLKPVVLFLLVEVILILTNVKGFDITYVCN